VRRVVRSDALRHGEAGRDEDHNSMKQTHCDESGLGVGDVVWGCCLGEEGRCTSSQRMRVVAEGGC
jgi:hypothetical protein